MFYSVERQVKIQEDELKKDRAKPKTRGEAEGVTLGFNTSENPKKKRQEILFRKF